MRRAVLAGIAAALLWAASADAYCFTVWDARHAIRKTSPSRLNFRSCWHRSPSHVICHLTIPVREEPPTFNVPDPHYRVEAWASGRVRWHY